jgi:hypothetical protein
MKCSEKKGGKEYHNYQEAISFVIAPILIRYSTISGIPNQNNGV